MTEITLRHEQDCDEDTYWERCFFNDDYNKKLYLEALRFPAYEVIDLKDSADAKTRKVRIEPPLGNLPGTLKRLVGDKMSYVETGTLDKKSKRYSFSVAPSTLADKTKISGEIWCEKIGDQKVARVARIRVEVKVLMVGGLLEDKIVQDLRRSYDEAAKFTNQYVRERGS